MGRLSELMIEAEECAGSLTGLELADAMVLHREATSVEDAQRQIVEDITRGPLYLRGRRIDTDYLRLVRGPQGKAGYLAYRADSGSGYAGRLDRIERADDLGLSEDYDPADEPNEQDWA